MNYNIEDTIIPEIEVWEFHNIFERERKKELERQNREKEKELFKKQYKPKARL